VGTKRTAISESVRLTFIFCINNRVRGTGDASKYRKVDHDASLATVSPLKSATTVTNKNGVEKNNIVVVKFAAPKVAKPIMSVLPEPNSDDPSSSPEGPNFTAKATSIGSERTKP
jgi:hypothetical protein